MASQKIEGVILSVRSYSENDALLNILVKDQGIGTYLSRGYKKSSKKIAADLQPLSFGTYLATLPKDGKLGYINGVEESHAFENVLNNVETTAYFAHVSELMERAFENNDPINYWYYSYISALKLVSEGVDVQNVVNVFEIQLLEPFGVAPILDRDAIDGATSGTFDYSEKFNGIIEQKHFLEDEHRLHLTAKEITVLRWDSIADLGKVNNFNISKPTQRGVQRVIDLIYDRQLGIKTRAKKVLEQIHSLERFAQE